MQAIVWLNISASALVQVCVVVGVIFGLEPALLGATVLAWGNSVPDLINNMAMAKDGFPSMAVAACFASPLFTLLVGMGGALIYGECMLEVCFGLVGWWAGSLFSAGV
jgi:sodium/potassium/calcium exchanger 6